MDAREPDRRYNFQDRDWLRFLSSGPNDSNTRGSHMKEETTKLLQATAKARKVLLILSIIWFTAVRRHQDFYPEIQISSLQEVMISLAPPMVIIILACIWYRVFKYKPEK